MKLIKVVAKKDAAVETSLFDSKDIEHNQKEAKNFLKIVKDLTAQDRSKEIVKQAKEVKEGLDHLYGLVYSSDEMDKNNFNLTEMMLNNMQSKLKAIFRKLDVRW